MIRRQLPPTVVTRDLMPENQHFSRRLLVASDQHDDHAEYPAGQRVDDLEQHPPSQPPPPPACRRQRRSTTNRVFERHRSWVDTGRAAKLAAERDALLGQVRAATGLGGRPRVPGSVHERARIAVRKAIVNAIDRIAAADPPLGRLLSDTVTTGGICRYDPDPDRPVRWVLSAR